MQFFTILLSVLTFAVSTTATPPHVAERSTGKLLPDVSFPITQPAGGETYYVGSTQICCWSTFDIPLSSESEKASLVIGHFDAGSNTGHTNYAYPLYSGFYLIAGCVIYVVPDVLAGDSYYLFLLGDSGFGSRSALFTIQPDPNSP